MKTLHILAIALFVTLTPAYVLAETPVGFEQGDTVASVLKRQIGQRVELRLNSGEKIAGKVEAVGEKTVHIAAMTGQEFFDAVVVLEGISAVVIRTGGK